MSAKAPKIWPALPEARSLQMFKCASFCFLLTDKESFFQHAGGAGRPEEEDEGSPPNLQAARAADH